MRAEFGICFGYYLNNPHNIRRIYSVQRDTMYMRNKFEGLVSLHEIENKSVDQLLNGTFEGVREGVAYPEADAEKEEATPSPYIHADARTAYHLTFQVSRSRTQVAP